MQLLNKHVELRLVLPLSANKDSTPHAENHCGKHRLQTSSQFTTPHCELLQQQSNVSKFGHPWLVAELLPSNKRHKRSTRAVQLQFSLTPSESTDGRMNKFVLLFHKLSSTDMASHPSEKVERPHFYLKNPADESPPKKIKMNTGCYVSHPLLFSMNRQRSSSSSLYSQLKVIEGLHTNGSTGVVVP